MRRMRSSDAAWRSSPRAHSAANSILSLISPATPLKKTLLIKQLAALGYLGRLAIGQSVILELGSGWRHAELCLVQSRIGAPSGDEFLMPPLLRDTGLI